MNHTELVSKLKSLVHEERKITAEILKHLREVEDRKVFAHMGYPSLFEFCIKELGYSEGAAQRRISAMRLIKELPQVEKKIISGALSLSVVSQAQTFFKKKKNLNKPMAVSEKLNLLSSLENTSTRECEKTLLQLAPEMVTKDKERYICPETLEIKITVDREFIENLAVLKNQLSHKMPAATTKDILAFALKVMVKKSIDDQRLREPSPISPLPPAPAAENLRAKRMISKSTTGKSIKSRYISIYAKRAIWKKGEGKCQYMDPITGRRCESKRFLEIDHIVPRVRAGSSNPENLQLLCDMHNRLKGTKMLKR